MKEIKYLSDNVPDERHIKKISDSLFNHLQIGDKIPSQDRDGLHEIIGAAIHIWSQNEIMYRNMLADLVDIYDDAMNNAPENRCYVDGAWKECLDDARKLLSVSEEESITCNRPPSGWHCTRLIGHSGPCAALPEVSSTPLVF